MNRITEIKLWVEEDGFQHIFNSLRDLMLFPVKTGVFKLCNCGLINEYLWQTLLQDSANFAVKDRHEFFEVEIFEAVWREQTLLMRFKIIVIFPFY